MYRFRGLVQRCFPVMIRKFGTLGVCFFWMFVFKDNNSSLVVVNLIFIDLNRMQLHLNGFNLDASLIISDSSLILICVHEISICF